MMQDAEYVLAARMGFDSPFALFRWLLHRGIVEISTRCAEREVTLAEIDAEFFGLNLVTRAEALCLRS